MDDDRLETERIRSVGGRRTRPRPLSCHLSNEFSSQASLRLNICQSSLTMRSDQESSRSVMISSLHTCVDDGERVPYYLHISWHTRQQFGHATHHRYYLDPPPTLVAKPTNCTCVHSSFHISVYYGAGQHLLWLQEELYETSSDTF